MSDQIQQRARYRVEVSYTTKDVYYVEALSPEQAQEYYDVGDPEETYVDENAQVAVCWPDEEELAVPDRHWVDITEYQMPPEGDADRANDTQEATNGM